MQPKPGIRPQKIGFMQGKPETRWSKADRILGVALLNESAFSESYRTLLGIFILQQRKSRRIADAFNGAAQEFTDLIETHILRARLDHFELKRRAAGIEHEDVHRYVLRCNSATK